MGGFLHELTGCMSQGAAGNPSVAMVEAAYAHHRLPWRYVNLEVPPAGLADAVRGARAMGFRGFNLSMPHKVAVIPMLAGLGESAALIGAVNCVVRRGDVFIGENTDGKGFLTSLQSVTAPRGKNVVLFGAGGAARAIAVELALAGARRIAVVNRSEARGADLVATLRDKTKVEAQLSVWRGDFVVPADTGVVINATSIGLYDAEARVPVALDSLRAGMVVADVVFSPPRTRLLREAAACGCVTLDGLGMLVNQGVIGVKYWTGVDPDPAVMRRALEQALGLGAAVASAPAGKLTPEEQMAAFEKELKETDWGHQPC
jgi:shikimate dehydrogenase